MIRKFKPLTPSSKVKERKFIVTLNNHLIKEFNPFYRYSINIFLLFVGSIAIFISSIYLLLHKMKNDKNPIVNCYAEQNGIKHDNQILLLYCNRINGNKTPFRKINISINGLEIQAFSTKQLQFFVQQKLGISIREGVFESFRFWFDLAKHFVHFQLFFKCFY